MILISQNHAKIKKRKFQPPNSLQQKLDKEKFHEEDIPELMANIKLLLDENFPDIGTSVLNNVEATKAYHEYCAQCEDNELLLGLFFLYLWFLLYSIIIFPNLKT